MYSPALIQVHKPFAENTRKGYPSEVLMTSVLTSFLFRDRVTKLFCRRFNATRRQLLPAFFSRRQLFMVILSFFLSS